VSVNYDKIAKNSAKSAISVGNQVQRIDEKEINEDDGHSVEPSEGSDPSGQVIEESSITDQKIPASIYRLGHSDKWACKNCNLRDDKWGMIKHTQWCRGAGVSNQKKISVGGDKRK
jgi:hypothetical protein